MSWVQISFTLAPEKAAIAEQLLDAFGAASITFTDAADQPIFEPDLNTTPLWQQSRCTGLFDSEQDIAEIVAQCQQILQLPANALSVEPLEDRDWERAWLDDFKPMLFGEQLCICPTAFEPVSGKLNIMLDPGLAFGTGTHPTTRLCLEWLDQHAAAVKDQTILDFGCGSGILAIAAGLLGAEHLDAVDIDPQAVTATDTNAERNGVQEKVASYLPKPFSNSHGQQQYDIVLANILANPLIELAPNLIAHLKPAGHLVLSGILAEQADSVLAAYRDSIDFQPIAEHNGWVCLHGQRRG
jgi:ribosomal protein L11 methyltransferase